MIRRALVLGVLAPLLLAVPLSAGARSLKQQSRCAKAQRRQEHSHQPRHFQTAVPSALTSLLGVLNSPETVKLPPGALQAGEPYLYSGFWLNSVHLLVSESQRKVYLVPGILAPPRLPAACRKLFSRHDLRVIERARQRQKGPAVLLSIYGESPNSESFEASGVRFGLSFTASQIKAGHAHIILPEFGGSKEPMYGLVPEGVESVTVMLGGISRSGLVHNNMFVVRVARAKAGKHTLVQRWYSPTGRLIKTITDTYDVLELVIR